MTKDAQPAVGALVRIKETATGSGSMAPGRYARVVDHTTGSYGFVPQVFVELIGEHTKDMLDAGIDKLDLYSDEYEVPPSFAIVDRPMRFSDLLNLPALRDELEKPVAELLDYTSPPAPTLSDLVKAEGYELVIDSNPQSREDALGNTGWQRIASAQLCEGKVIAVTEELTNAAYCVSHEIAHDKRGFNDEKEVLLEQADILGRWVRKLLDHIHGKV